MWGRGSIKSQKSVTYYLDDPYYNIATVSLGTLKLQANCEQQKCYDTVCYTNLDLGSEMIIFKVKFNYF